MIEIDTLHDGEGETRHARHNRRGSVKDVAAGYGKLVGRGPEAAVRSRLPGTRQALDRLVVLTGRVVRTAAGVLRVDLDFTGAGVDRRRHARHRHPAPSSKGRESGR